MPQGRNSCRGEVEALSSAALRAAEPNRPVFLELLLASFWASLWIWSKVEYSVEFLY